MYSFTLIGEEDTVKVYNHVQEYTLKTGPYLLGSLLPDCNVLTLRLPCNQLLGHIHRGHNTMVITYEFYVLVARTIPHLFPAFTREILFLHENIKFISSS